MSITDLHLLHSVQIGSAGPTLLGGIVAQSGRTGSTIRGELVSGSVYAIFQSLISQSPRAGFTTVQIERALDKTGVQFWDMGTATQDVTLFAQKAVQAGTRAGASAHRSFNVVKGLLVPRTLTVAHQEDAQLEYELIVTHDGSANDPILQNENVSLPAIVDDEHFTLKSVQIGGISIAEVRNLTIDFGIDVRAEGSDSEITESFAYVNNIVPTITVNTMDILAMKSDAIPFGSAAVTHANTIITLQKRASGGKYESSGSDLTFTMAGQATAESFHEASGNEPQMTTIQVQGKFDGTNAPLVFTSPA